MMQTAPERPSLEDLVLGPKPGPGPDCPDELVVFHAASGLLSGEEQQAFERHLHTCLYCRDRELEARKLLYFEQHGVPYTLDSWTGRLRRARRLPLLLSALSPPSLVQKLRGPGLRRLVVAFAPLLAIVLAWLAASPALARSPAVLAAAKQAPLVRWLLPASVREYLEATLLWDRLAQVPAQDRSRWQALAAQAEKRLLRALHLDPGQADAHFLLGQIYAERYYRLQDRAALEQARVHYLRAIALQPDHLEARYRLADDVYSAQGRWDQELEQYNAILQLDPTHTDARWARGWVYLERGELDRAIADFRQVLRQDPRDFETLWAVAIAQALGRRTPDLQDTLRELRRINPGRAEVLEKLLARPTGRR